MSDTLGLSVSDVVTTQILLSPVAAQTRNFGTLLVVGTSPVIDTTERIRSYTTLAGVANDFGSIAPEFLAAQAFFAQSPQPTQIKIGIWAQNVSPCVLHGVPITASVVAANLAVLQTVTNGTFSITIDGAVHNYTGLNFSACANMNAVAAVIQAFFGVPRQVGNIAIITWDGTEFIIRSVTASATAGVSIPSSPTGVNIPALMGLAAGSGAYITAGSDPETAIAGILALIATPNDFYALTLAPGTPIADSVYLQVAALVEGLSPAQLFGVTIQNTQSMLNTSTTDLGAMLQASGYDRTVSQYSATNPYAICSYLGRALTVNFEGSRTTLTMKFKREPGVIAETIRETWAATLTRKNINVYAIYANGSAIIQQGVMASGRFFDEVHGLDWLQNRVQNDLWNTLYQSLTKIPQTDDGVHVLLTQMEASLAQAAVNGLIAPGIWNAEGFGMLKRGDPLPKGFYVYAPLVASQSQANREARKAPVLQAAIKMAGAIHFVDTIISVNR